MCEREERQSEREREAAQVTLVVSLSEFDPGQRGVFGGGTGERCLLLFDQRGARREKRSGILWDFLCLFVKYGPCEGMCCLFSLPHHPYLILLSSQSSSHQGPCPGCNRCPPVSPELEGAGILGTVGLGGWGGGGGGCCLLL